MPKYSQTLLGSQYTANDLSNSLKTAADALGWGTGKVDIAGGYRFTSTEEAASDTTPLVLSDVLESATGRVVRPNFADLANYPGGNNLGYSLAMYLPGVKDFRVKYTLLSLDQASVPDGTVIANANSNTWLEVILSYSNINDVPTTDLEQMPFGQNTVAVSATNISTLTVGASYFTPWSATLSTKTILSHASAGFRFVATDSQKQKLVVRIDQVEYKVSQKKFAFQSPNLDSPMFEVLTHENTGGVMQASVTTLPYKYPKVAFMRLDRCRIQTATSSLIQDWNRILFNVGVRPSEQQTFGQITKPFTTEMLMQHFNKANDTAIYMGSNSTFDGFYLNTQQGLNANTVCWDTLDKQSGFPLSVAQKPAARIGHLEGGSSRDFGYTGASYGNRTKEVSINELYFIKNDTKLTGLRISIPYLYPGTIQQNLRFNIYKVSKVGDNYVYDALLGTALYTATTLTQYSMNIPLDVPSIDLTAGSHIMLVGRGRLATLDNIQMSLRFPFQHEHVEKAYRTSEGAFLGSPVIALAPKVNSPISSIRYIRDTLNGSNANGGNHWIEIQAFVGATNVALNAPVTGAGNNLPNSIITNGTTNSTNEWTSDNNNYIAGSVTVDLGSAQAVTSVKVWHFYADSRSYTTTTEVSQDGITWHKIFDSEIDGSYNETSAGRTTSTAQISTPLAPGQVISYKDPIAPEIVAHSYEGSAGLILSGTETPTKNIQFFAENWAVLGSFQKQYGSFKLNTGILDIYSNGGSFHYIYSHVPFGLDPNMSKRYRRWPRGNGFPGYDTDELMGNNRLITSFRIGMQGLQTILETRPMARMWNVRIKGIPVRHNNLFIWPGPKTLNTSIVTPDGSEYFCIASGTKASVFFRLK